MTGTGKRGSHSRAAPEKEISLNHGAQWWRNKSPKGVSRGKSSRFWRYRPQSGPKSPDPEPPVARTLLFAFGFFVLDPLRREEAVSPC